MVALGRRQSRGREPERPPLPDEGTVVEVVRPDRGSPWSTRVEWVDGWTLCVVAPLRQDGQAWPLPPGSTLAVSWPTDLGVLQATTTLREATRDVVVTWVLDVQRVERRQRRSAYRLPYRGPVVVVAGGKRLEGTLCDLSEGGLRCQVPRTEAPERGATVQVELTLPDHPLLDVRATVVRRQEPDHRTAELGLAFVRPDEHLADELRRFVFAEQLRQRAGT